MTPSNELNSLRYGELNPYGLDGKWEGENASGSASSEKRETDCPKDCGDEGDLLVLNNTDPGSLLAVTGTQPDIVRSGEADFDREMDPSSQRSCMFPVEQFL